MKTIWSLAVLLVLFFTIAASAQADFDGGAPDSATPAAEAQAEAVPADAPQKRIEVNLATQRMIAWEGEQIVFEFAVTTGEEGQETLIGDFEILDKEADAYSYAWQMTLPFWLGIYQVGELENGIHALPLTPDGEELWGDALGVYPASHGCIVLASADAQMLFDWADVGTPVNIHD